MKFRRILCTVASFSMVLLSQKDVLGKPADEKGTFGRVIESEINTLERQLVGAAEAMPEGKFNFSPEDLAIPASKLQGVRTFALQVRHVAADNYALWLAAAGKPEPPGVNSPNGPEEMKSRAEILKFLKDSFVAARQAAAQLTHENELDLVDFRGRKITRLALVILALNHGNDHYGQMVEYLRMCGIDPQAGMSMSMPKPK